MKCLVTGGAGFIGSHIVDLLIENKHEVIVIDNLSTGNLENLNKKAKFIQKDINDKDLSEILIKEKPECVFHLAAQINVRKSIESPKDDALVNIVGSLNLLDACVKSKVKKVIFSSTGGALYGEANVLPTPEEYPKKPESPYGIAKLTIENYLAFYKLVHGLDFTILRYGNVYGPRQNSKGEAGVISIFISRAIQNLPLTVFGDGEQTRDYVYVKDVAKANILAIKNSGIYNVGTSKETSLNDIIKLLNAISKKKNKLENKEAIKGELRKSCLDNKKLKSIGWKNEIDLEKGLKDTYEFLSNFYKP